MNLPSAPKGGNYLSSKAVYYTNILEKTMRNKAFNTSFFRPEETQKTQIELSLQKEKSLWRNTLLSRSQRIGFTKWSLESKAIKAKKIE